MGPLLVLLAYLSGSIPFGLLITRAVTRTDVRTVGSGNIGATNVARAAGKKIGLITLLLDALKSFVPALVAVKTVDPWWTAGVGLAAVLGHVFPVWLRFRGGKGVATSLGVLLATLPGVAAVGVGVYALVYLLFRISSLASLLASVTATVLAVATAPLPLAVMTFAIVLIVLLRHRGNIRRLLRRQESRV